ncbi:MAG: T9SS type A sorting domain-containing protein [Bacteroidetes bacterium]|nr:T9SS type A sorting domain-containing protein [Bacteroidota bacterium]MBP6426843.1 T9SS type A sorting domain-containing protein [Bacteroidia bacterium]
MKKIITLIFSLAFIFCKTEKSFSQPTLLSPANGQVVPAGTILFDWTDVSGSTGYSLQVSYDSTFITVFKAHSSVSELPLNSINGTIYWRVKSGYFGTWSNFFSVTSTSSPQLTGINPDNAYVGQNFQPTLSGVNTHFAIASSTLQFNFSQGNFNFTYYRRYDYWSTDTTYPSASFTVPQGAPTGLYNVNYYNAIDGPMIIHNGFYVHGSNTYQGQVYFDMNSNAVYDAGDIPYSQAIVTTSSSTHTNTLPNGNYSDFLPAGTYTLNVANLPSYYVSVPSDTTITLLGNDSIVGGLNFALQPIPGVHDVKVSFALNRNNARPGLPIEMTLTYRNKGPVTESGRVYAIVPLGLTVDSASVSGYTMSGDTMFWNYSGLPIGGSDDIVIYFSVSNSLPIGAYIEYVAGVEASGSDIFPVDNIHAQNQLVSNSFDPNYKTVSPENLSVLQMVTGQFADFTIHFQNTGTDTAYLVRILDTISTNLDLSTFEVISSSHNYNVVFYPNRVMGFYFNGINLPDTGTNEPLSHGYITYRLKALPTLTFADQISNTAYIYFDQNSPVMTNTCYVTISVGLDELFGKSDFTVSPNPFTGEMSFNLNRTDNFSGIINVKNIFGQIVFSKKVSDLKGNEFTTFNLEFLTNGIYFLELNDGDSNVVSKIIKQ